MSERAEIRAVLEEAREWQGRTRAFRSPLENMVSRLIDALAESLAEVERLRQAVDDAVHLYHAALEERDEARAGDQS